MKLYLFYDNRLVGICERDNQLMHTFHYTSSWLESKQGFPASFQLPLRAEPYGNRDTLSFFENLLPEGDLRKQLKLADNAFAFLTKYGLDCAGAFQVSPNPDPPEKRESGRYKEIPLEVLESAHENHEGIAAVVAQEDPGYLSLAGAQDKIAVFLPKNLAQLKTVQIPIDGQATTHIIKAPIRRRGVKDTVYNELYCMRLAKTIGLDVPECSILKANKVPFYVVERYDRDLSTDPVKRLHQQDFC
jgi:serine/threonine-protein kinase HipA